MINIVFLDSYTRSTTSLSEVRTFGNFVEYEYTEEKQVVERAADAEVIITNKTPLRAATLERLTKLKLIAIAATGMNNVDLDAAARLGIRVMNAAGYSTDTVAESTFAGVLSLMRNSAYYDRFVKSGVYSESGRTFDFSRKNRDLRGKTWGIVGLGTIGKRVAEIASVFGCEVIYFSASGNKQDVAYQCVGLDELLQRSDVLSIHAPLTDQTTNLIDYPQLCQMKPGAILCNVARGGIVNEASLARALNENRIAGAVVDVYTQEPVPADNPLFTVEDKDKLLLSPHNAWSSVESSGRLFATVVENIRTFLQK